MSAFSKSHFCRTTGNVDNKAAQQVLGGFAFSEFVRAGGLLALRLPRVAPEQVQAGYHGHAEYDQQDVRNGHFVAP